MSWLLVAAAAVLTSTLSGALGMAGGVLLLTLCTAVLPVEAAMVAHGVTQIASNGSRAWLHRAHADLRWVARYAVGVAVTAACVLPLLPRVDAAWVHVALGAVALGGVLLRGRLPAAASTSRWAGVACGASVTLVQVVAGVAGPLLDVFFVRSPLPRHAVVATKAATQVLAHTVKVAFWIVVARERAVPATTPPWGYALCAAAAVLGTLLGARLLDRITDAAFRRATTALVALLGAAHVAWGVALLAL
jgi:uncharacterized protein